MSYTVPPESSRLVKKLHQGTVNLVTPLFNKTDVSALSANVQSDTEQRNSATTSAKRMLYSAASEPHNPFCIHKNITK